MSDATQEREALARFIPWAVLGVTVLVAIPLGVLRGGATVALWLAFALLASAVLLFWESLRSLIDPSAPVEEEEDEASRVAAVEARKNSALRALKDIAFERSIGRLGEDDYAELEARYRAEAKEALASIDEGVKAWRDAAEALLDKAERGALGEAEPEPEASHDDPPAPVAAARDGAACEACGTTNDDDAVFCKRCGARVREEATDANA